MEQIFQLDQSVLLWLQSLHTAWLDALMIFFTRLGDYGSVWFPLSARLLFFPKYRRTGILLLTALGTGYLFGDVFLKNVVERERPFLVLSEGDLLISPPGSDSFPSGQTLSSFATATVIFLANRRFGVVAYCLAAFIGFSRYLFAHYPTGVLAGLLLSVLVAAFIVFWSKTSFSISRVSFVKKDRNRLYLL